MAWNLFLLLLLATVLLLCRGFNIDTESPTRFKGDWNGHFGYKVGQLKTDSTSWVVVSAPLAKGDSGQRSGALYRCSYKEQACQSIPVNNSLPISLGLSLSTKDLSPAALMACGPTFAHLCEENSFLNGICYIFDQDFQLIEELRPSYQECISGVDAVILYDDSNSISTADFRKMKDFMVDLIRSLKEFNIQIAVVQYSTDINLVFDFIYYQQVGDLKVLKEFPHTKGNTYTPSAIKYVTDELFTAKRGARSNTKRLLITITDGASNDRTTTFLQANEAANRKQIIRYAIGVGDVFRNTAAQQELNTIASSQENVFQVGSFSALASIRSTLAEKIFDIEGTQAASNGSSFQRELSQGGFSAVLSQDTITLGTVGAYDWSGGLEEIRRNTSTFINVTSQDGNMKDSYLGYAVTVAHSGGELLYVAGAPRHNHVGRVVVFQRDTASSTWRARQHLEGEQVGSYFGAELTSVDLDGDDETDLVLIGAPLYHAQGIGGMVHVCSVRPGENFTCNATLRGSVGNTLGRFGATLATLGDVSWDGFADVAVGAPLEDEHRGAVYIFHGQKDSLGTLPTQKILGAAFSPGLMYFGLSIHGRLDLSEDGLKDIAVGSLGQALILRSRPVILVSASIAFDPPRIPLDRVECSRQMHDPSLPVGNATICFTIARISQDSLGDLSLQVNYSLLVDMGRRETEQSRFLIGDRGGESIEVTMSKNCVQRRIRAPVCIEDFLSPVKLMMNFSVAGEPIANARGLRPILDPSSNTGLEGEVSFEMICGDDEVCTANLKVSFNYSGAPALVAIPGFLLNLTVMLENVGELAHGPRLRLLYPAGLSFRRAALLQSLRRTALICDMTGISGSQSGKSIWCAISPSVLREGTQATFQISFQVLVEDPWGDLAQFTVRAYSENENETLEDNVVTKDIPVVLAANVIIKSLESVAYLNFSTQEPERRHLSHSFQVQNLGRRALPVNVTIQLPLRLEFGFLWNVSSMFTVKGTNTVCSSLGDATSVPANTGTSREETSGQWSGVLSIRVIQCHISSLPRTGTVDFHFRGDFYPSSDAQLSVQKLWVRSEASITIDEARYYQSPEEKFHRAQVLTEVEVISAVNLLPIVLGSSIAGLVLLALLVAILYRLGFFKRTLKLEAEGIAGQVELTTVPPLPEETEGQGEIGGQTQNRMSEPPSHEEANGGQTQDIISEAPTPEEAKDQRESSTPTQNAKSELPAEANNQGEIMEQSPDATSEAPAEAEDKGRSSEQASDATSEPTHP